MFINVKTYALFIILRSTVTVYATIEKNNRHFYGSFHSLAYRQELFLPIISKLNFSRQNMAASNTHSDIKC